MSTAVMTERAAESSPRLKARIAGFFWLMTFLMGTAALVLRSRLSEGAAGVVAPIDLIASACYATATVLVYQLLKPVNQGISLFAAVVSLLGCTVGVLNGFHLNPLADVLPFNLHFTFFGLHCLLVGYLILRSTFMPRIVGALMAFGGLGWLAFSFSNLLPPPLAPLSSYLMAPGIIGEAVLTLSLLIYGVNVERWRAEVDAAVAAGRRT